MSYLGHLKKLIWFLVLVMATPAFLAAGGKAEEPEAGAKPYQGKQINVAVYAGGVKGAISGPLYYMRDEWQQATGAKLAITEIPFPQMYEKIFTDLRSGAGVYDGFVMPAFFYGDLIAGNYIVAVDEFMNDSRFPKWNPMDQNPASRQLIQWGGKYYGPSFDSDAEIIYARKDLFTDPSHKAAFLNQYGYELALPTTWEQAVDIAHYFNGKDLNGDGQGDYGYITLFSGVELGMWFLSHAGAYNLMPGPTVDRYHNVVLFDPETMEPRVNSPGFKKALETFKELYKTAPKASLGWGLTEQWDLFMRRKVAFALSCGDLATLSQDTNRSEVRGMLLCGPAPGTKQVWDYQTSSWRTMPDVNRIGNIHGASWHGVISRYSRNKEATYHLFAYLAQQPIKQKITLLGWPGIDPGMAYDFPPEASGGRGKGSLDQFVQIAGVDRADILQSLTAYWKNYYEMDGWIPYNRLPGASEMLNSFEINITAYLADQKTADEALNTIAADMRRIARDRGTDEMKAWYHQAIGYGKPAPNPSAE